MGLRAALLCVLAGGCIESTARTDFDEPSPDASIGTDGSADLAFRPPLGPASLTASPEALLFEPVLPGAVSRRVVSVTNAGPSPATLERVFVRESAAFTPLVRGLVPRSGSPVMEDPDADGTPGLSAGGRFEIEVSLAPEAGRSHRGTLVVAAEGLPPLEIPLADFTPETCLRAEPESLGWRTAVGRTRQADVTLLPCSEAAVEVAALRIEGPDAARFALGANTPVPPFTVAGPRRLSVAYTPLAEGDDSADLVAMGPDGSFVLRVPLGGVAESPECPIPIAAPAEQRVPPLTIVELTGRGSIDPDAPDGTPAEYHWTVVERPAGSTAQMVEIFPDFSDPSVIVPDNPATPWAHVFIDLAGLYTVELRVTGEAPPRPGLCERVARATIEARPDDAIYVQATWNTPGDPDPTDRLGTDLDLHLRHPLAEGWFLSPGDCYYGNPAPDWGILGARSDDPVLDIDDINGAGPESISLNEPENTETFASPYLVGVHYYKSHERATGEDYGGSTAEVRIFLQGELVLSVPDIPLPVEDNMCQVAEIEWPEATATRLLECYETRP